MCRCRACALVSPTRWRHVGAALWRHTRVSRLGARAFEISKAKENLMAAFGNMLLANGKAMASTRRTGRPSRRAATGVSDAINAAKDCDDQVNKAERDEAERRRNAAQWRAAAQRRAASARSSTAPPAAPPAARRRQRQPRQQGQHDEAPAVAVVARSEDSTTIVSAWKTLGMKPRQSGRAWTSNPTARARRMVVGGGLVARIRLRVPNFSEIRKQLETLMHIKYVVRAASTTRVSRVC